MVVLLPRSKQFLAVGFAVDPDTQLGPSPYLAPVIQQYQQHHNQQQQDWLAPLHASQAYSAAADDDDDDDAGKSGAAADDAADDVDAVTGAAAGDAGDAGMSGAAADASAASVAAVPSSVVATAAVVKTVAKLKTPAAAASFHLGGPAPVDTTGTTLPVDLWCSWLNFPPDSLPAKLSEVEKIPGAPGGAPVLDVELPEKSDKPRKALLNVSVDVAYGVESPMDLLPYWDRCLQQQVSLGGGQGVGGFGGGRKEGPLARGCRGSGDPFCWVCCCGKIRFVMR